jgi:hypothetical protein
MILDVVARQHVEAKQYILHEDQVAKTAQQLRRRKYLQTRPPNTATRAYNIFRVTRSSGLEMEKDVIR